MPKNTRVYRCVNKLKKKYAYSKSIAICQKSTKQNYITGKKIRKKTRKQKIFRNKTRRRRKKKLNSK